MWDSLSAKIIETITANIGGSITGIDAANVFDYEVNVTNSYPAITVVPADNANGVFADTRRNERSYIFSMKAYQERMSMTPQKAEQALRQLTDQLITTFDANYYLNGSFLQGRGFVKPIPSAWAYIQTEQVDVRLSNILLECVVIQ